MMVHIQKVIRLLLSTVISLIILSGFCMIYNYTGCRITNQSGSTDFKWEGNQFFSNMKEGFAWFTFDKNGYNNENDTDFDIQPIDILVVGSSHMEAVQMKPSENASALLNQMLPEYRTYNIGLSSHNIYACVKNLSAAFSEFQPRKFVIMETQIDYLSMKSMESVLNDAFPKVVSHDSGFMFWIQKKVPAFKSLFKSFAEWIDASPLFVSSAENKDSGNAEFMLPDGYEDCLNQFLNKARSSVPDDCQLIILFHPKTKIDANGEFIMPDETNRNMFKEVCENNGIVFVDMTESFRKLYEEKYILGHGFSNTELGVGHLNTYGHQAIAEELTKTIKELEHNNDSQ